MPDPSAERVAHAIVDEVGAALADGLFARQSQARVLDRLPICDASAAADRQAQARGWLERIAQVPFGVLSPELDLDLRVALWTARRWSHEADWWPLVHDPLGLGFYGIFGPTAYAGGWQLTTALRLLAQQPLETRADAERYLGLSNDLASMVRAMGERLRVQAARRIFVPRPQLEPSQQLVAKLRVQAAGALTADGERAGQHPWSAAFRAKLARICERALSDAFDALLTAIEPSVQNSTEPVGLSRLPGGGEVYEALARLHTQSEMTPEEIHRAGLARIAEIREQMRALRAAAGFRGDDRAFLAHFSVDPVWRASGPDAIAERFGIYIRRVDPLLDAVLRHRPAAPHGVAPLPEALEGSMTFGFYQAPARPGEAGRYLFNTANLAATSLVTTAAICFHELAPGHHIHLASQLENESLSDVRKHNSFNAFNEGWAEYAAALAGEHGLYETPAEQFGRLIMDAMLTSRLVVDTGLNALGLSLEAARDYMRENAFISEAEIASETLRYACDIPGQALAYKLGDTFFQAERERARSALGAAFDIRDFHDALLRPGALPLPLVARQVDAMIDAGLRRDAR